MSDPAAPIKAPSPPYKNKKILAYSFHNKNDTVHYEISLFIAELLFITSYLIWITKNLIISIVLNILQFCRRNFKQ